MSLFARVLLLLLIVSSAQATTQQKGTYVEPTWEAAKYTISISDQQSWRDIAQSSSIPISILKKYNKTTILKAGKKLIIPAKEIYLTKNRDSAISIAAKYGLNLSELVHLNDLNPPYEIQADQKLRVIDMTQVLKATEFKLAWPMKGKIVETFKAKGNDYLTIDGDNSEAKSAANGTIVYVGNEIGNYGNLVIIKHMGDYYSSYGNLGEITVAKGESIKTGQIVGEADNSLLYFGLRKDTNAIDPMQYLPKNKRNN